jgi:hypothetical protein
MERRPLKGFEGSYLQVKLPARDYTKMSARQLLREGRQMYAGLQALWRVELTLPNPDWEILASVSRQLKILEHGCPEVCEL